MWKKILYGFIAIFLIIQLFRPEKNISDDQTNHISNLYDVPTDVANILNDACYNCHSNKTEYPWYAKVQPSAWWLANHVKKGKRGLNFSEFTNRNIAYQHHKFEEIIEMVGEKKMPLPSYTWLGLHPEAKITDGQRQILIDWASEQMDILKAKYPADSLVMKRR